MEVSNIVWGGGGGGGSVVMEKSIRCMQLLKMTKVCITYLINRFNKKCVMVLYALCSHKYNDNSTEDSRDVN